MIIQQIKKPRMRVIIFYNHQSKCWNCNTYLDIEEIIFNNQCWVCGNSQGFDKEELLQW